MKQVGPALLFSLLIIVVSLMTVFLYWKRRRAECFGLLGERRRLHRLLLDRCITLVPVLMVPLIRGQPNPESANPICRFTQAVYLPVLRLCLKNRKLAIAINLLFLAAMLPVAFKLRSSFMSPLLKARPCICPLRFLALVETQENDFSRKPPAVPLR
jgi:Cu(I)/Ag(I) efflux system membrane protein CusA/SilA